MSDIPESLYRIDRFTVPERARDAFLERLVFIRDFLQGQPGCLYNRIGEARQEDGSLAMVTIVEWSTREAMNAARGEARAFYEKTGFDPGSFMTALGIEPDFGLFADIRAGDHVTA
tara:strand:+ start:6939 stop:7286 length:348 start_codon:yes stop_codon:yes gene_type:complete